MRAAQACAVDVAVVLGRAPRRRRLPHVGEQQLDPSGSLAQGEGCRLGQHAATSAGGRRSEATPTRAVHESTRPGAGWIYSPASDGRPFTDRPAARAARVDLRRPQRRPAARRRLRPRRRDVAGRRRGPLLVIAGAGSGKTLTLAARVGRLVLAGADPSRILMLTFSRRAAAEMERRVGRVLHDALGLASTQHGAAAAVVRHLPRDRRAAAAPARGADRARSRTSRSTTAPIPKTCCISCASGSTSPKGTKRFPQKATCLAIYSRAVNARKSLADVLAESYPWCADSEAEPEAALRRLRRREAGAARARLRRPARLVGRGDGRSGGRARRSRRASTTSSSTSTRTRTAPGRDRVRACGPTARNLTVVGDDAQSIYSFRAAEVRNILDFADRFAPAATVVALEQNYRSTAPLLAASNAVIALAAERHAEAAVERSRMSASGRRWSGSRTSRPKPRGSPTACSRCASRAWR